MNIAELKGEKSVAALAKRLLADSKAGSARSSRSEMEAALLRLNPHLRQIGKLDKGTPIRVPDEFALASDQSSTPLTGLTDELLRQAEIDLTSLRSTLKQALETETEQTQQAQIWLKGDQARDVLRRAPELKDVFSSATTAAASVVKAQAAAAAAEEEALSKVQAELADFRKAFPA
ncbi:MAG: hypothetical protein QOE70_848 [Chthoniobacter sp.]|jgi:hypothetical protein|nr:hypothetical protein [Chthoniobacter sp.]